MNDVRLGFVPWRRGVSFFSRQARAILFAILTLGFISASYVVAVEPIDEASDESLPRVFVTSVADYRSFTKAGLEGVKRDFGRIEFFFKENVASKLLEYSSVDPNAATPEAVLAAIDKLKEKNVGKNDVVFFYYTGHAAFNPEKGGHYFQLKDDAGKAQALYRSDVKSRLLALNARLVVILTDCCNVMERVPEGRAYSVDAVSRGKDLSPYTPVIKRLFADTKTRGVVDLTSSVPGEISLAYEDGSLATSTAIRTFVKLNKELTDDSSANVTWRRFFEEWTKETLESSKERLKSKEGTDEQAKQTPHAYELPDFPRLGARVLTGEGIPAGVKISEILKDSPAEQIGLCVGDYIVRIGEIMTAKEQDYDYAVDVAPRKTKITFVRYDKDDKENDGKEQTLEVELNGTPIKSTKPTKDDETTSSSELASATDPEEKPEEHEPFVGLALDADGKVLSVASGSPAADAGFREGDVVRSFDGKEIYDDKDYAAAVESAGDAASLGVKTKDGRKIKIRVEGIRTKPRVKSSGNGAARAFSGIAFERESNLPKVASVKEGSPASKAGVQVGDVVRRLNDDEIVDVKDYDAALKNVSDEAELVVLRKGKTRKLNLSGLRSGTQDSQSNGENQTGRTNQTNRKGTVFGAGLGDETENEIVQVVPDSPAEKAGLRVGDKLLKFDGKTIQTQSDFSDAVDEAVKAGRKTVSVEYETSGRTRTVDVKLNL